MAQTHQHISLTTLQEVERLLTSTEFATIDDLAKRASVGPLTSALGAGTRTVEPAAGPDTAAPLLPKRR